MSDQTSARLALPLLQAGQAQKELHHNEALTLLDLATQASVAAVGIDTPPATPAIGDCWIVGTVPTGAWTGAAQALAGWTSGGWRFVPAIEGMTIWSRADGMAAQFRAGTWTLGTLRGAELVIDGARVLGPRAAAIADPVGGATIDGEARAVLGQVLATLRTHGLIAT